MEFDFVDDGGEGGDESFGAFGAESELVGEVEAVDAADIHKLEGFDEAGEHGGTDDMDDGLAVAIGLVDGLSAEEVEALIVEADALREFGLGSVAGLEDLVVEEVVAHLFLFDGGIGLLEIGEVDALEAVDSLGHVFGFVLHDGGILQVGILCDVASHLIGEGVLGAALEGVGEGFEDEVVIEDGVEVFALQGEGEVLAVGPGEGVLDGVDLGGGGLGGVDMDGDGGIVVAAGGEEESCEDQGVERQMTFHDETIFLNSNFQVIIV